MHKASKMIVDYAKENECDRIIIGDIKNIKQNMKNNKRFVQMPINAIGIIPSSGKYSIGTFAHPDIAFEFASWLNVKFKLYLITEFERLKQNESYQNCKGIKNKRIR